MTRLLVSVRDADEAEIAVNAGVDIIDLKEPSRGSLGPVSPEIAHQVAQSVGARCVLSLAMGELFLSSKRCDVNDYDTSALAAFEFAKVGMAGADDAVDWRKTWLEWRRSLPGSIQPVAVSYVDPMSGSPSPEELLAFAHSQSIETVLLDTYSKNGDENLFSWVNEERLRDLITQASAVGILLAIAGSLSTETVAKAKVMNPSIVAVRTAACLGGRRGKLCANRVARLKEICRQKVLKKIQ